MSKAWCEVQHAQNEKRCELVITGPIYSERIAEDGLDKAIFTLTHLNFLEISKTCLKDLPPDIGELCNLTRVVICHNDLSTLPREIANLKKLKFLDISHNNILELPSELSELNELQSLNVSSNKLSTLPDVSNLLKLVTLNISYNQFSALPRHVCNSKLTHFTDLLANNNQISAIPSEIETLSSLKVLDLAENDIACIPGELGHCTKLKELNLKGNKLKDKRLLKLVDQCHVKQIMDYIRNHCPKSGSSDGDTKTVKKKGGKQNKKTEVEKVVEMLDELKILHSSEQSIKVVSTTKVAEVRPYIVCCQVLDVDLTDSDLLKKFIVLQNKLHDTICEKRTAATIATHDFSKIQGDLLYDARPPKEIMIVPLNRSREVSAAELYIQLNEEADALRKEKKKNTYSGIHKYLYLLKDKPLYPCLVDQSNNMVISFPPITNSEGTKISSETRSMLLEVTGCNLPICRRIMDSLLIEMLKLGIGGMSSSSTPQRSLSVRQVKVVDEEGGLKVVYPSRTDLCNGIEGIDVVRC